MAASMPMAASVLDPPSPNIGTQGPSHLRVVRHPIRQEPLDRLATFCNSPFSLIDPHLLNSSELRTCFDQVLHIWVSRFFSFTA